MLHFKKIIALLSVIVLLFPTIIQFHHAFEDHDHAVICKASNSEHHFHEDVSVDCSQLHYDFQTFFLDVISNDNLIQNPFYPTNFNHQPENTKVVYTSFKSSRAPPMV